MIARLIFRAHKGAKKLHKAILSFREVDELQVALDGHRWKKAMEELDEEIRDRAKYNNKYTWSDEEIRDKIREILYDNQLQLE